VAVLQESYLGLYSQTLTPDAYVLVLTTLGGIATALLISALPAWSVSRRRQTLGLRPERTVAPSGSRWSRALLVAQVALSLVILVGAALFVSSLDKLRQHDTGVHMDNLRWTRLFAVPNGYRNQNDAVYYPELVRQLSDVPGVQAVALASYFPNFFGLDNLVATQPTARSGSDDPSAAVDAIMENVTPRFFETLGVRVLGGRDFTWADDAQHPAVAIVNESLTQKLFPGGNAIGQRIRIGNDPRRRDVEIVGIVADAAIGSYTHTHLPVAFRPRMQELQSSRAPALVFRVAGDARAADREIAAVIQRLGHEYPRRFLSLNEQVHQALLRERLLATASTFFAALGVLLVFIGFYAALAFAVAARTREIGVRMALGSTRSRVVRMIVGESLVLTLLGVALGIPVALGAGGLIASLLFDLQPSDPLTLAAASTLFVGVAVAAAARPALRASGVDPMAALRAE
jgi:putative ABC transport system permease protein